MFVKSSSSMVNTPCGANLQETINVQANELNAVIGTERVFPVLPRKILLRSSSRINSFCVGGAEGFYEHVRAVRVQARRSVGSSKMHGPNGVSYPNESLFREIRPETRIVIEHVVDPWFRLTVTLTAHGDQTHLAWDQEFES